MDHRNYMNNNMNLNQILKITGSVSLVTLLALSQRGALKAEEIVEPTTNRLNLEPISINYGDTRAIANLSKTILKDHVNLLSDLVEVEKNSSYAVYSLDDYIVSVYYDAHSGLGIKDVKLTIETKFTHSRKDEQKIIASNDQSNCEIVEGAINEYNVSVKVNDNLAPVIKLSKNSVTIKENGKFDIHDYVKVTDNVDGKLSYTVKGNVKKKDGKYVPGKYTLKIIAKDSSGNETVKEFKVVVKKTPKKTVTNNYYSKNTDTSGYKGANAVVASAYAQVGTNQDCTSLVSNALASAGVYFRGWPAEYLSLGYTVSAAQAKPGDIVYYADGGLGVPHVAIYVGNGKAVHGGWYGYTTVVSSVYGGSGPVFIRVTK